MTGHAREEGVRRDLDAAAALAERTLSGPATYLEKPVTAKIFVNAVAAVLKVELESQGETRKPGDSTLRDEIQELLRGADSETLRNALKVLRDAQRG